MNLLRKLMLLIPLLGLSFAVIGCDAEDELEIERGPGGVEEVERD